MNNIEKIIEQKWHESKNKMPGSQYQQIQNIRKEALKQFLQQGLPGKHLEKWKYIDLKNIKSDFANDINIDEKQIQEKQIQVKQNQQTKKKNIVKIILKDGKYQGEKGAICSGIYIDDCQDILNQPDHAHFSDVIAKIDDSSLNNLARAFIKNGFVLTINQEVKPNTIIHIDYQDQAVNHRKTLFVNNIITVKPKAKICIVETSAEQKNAKTVNYHIQQRLRIAEHAECHHCSILKGEQENLTYIGSDEVDIADDAKYYAHTITTGKGLIRNEKNINIRGEYVEAYYAVAHLLEGEARHNSCFEIRHHKPQSNSNAVAKAILAQNAVAASQGKIYVAPDAQKTQSYEMFSGMMLGQTSQYLTKPELEIYADDVVCGHGATIADFDQDAQFYLKSRGIRTQNARKILAKAYIQQVFENIDENIFENFVEKCINDNLEQILKYAE